MNSACVDLIYLDPPFNSNRNYFLPIGSDDAETVFEDVWAWGDIDLANLGELREKLPELGAVIDVAYTTHSSAMASYLAYMGVRVIEMKRLLKSTGSMYLHCDPTASHYLKLLMDAAFGKGQFRNEVVWGYRGMPSGAKKWQSKHDVVLFYTKSDDYNFNVLRGKPTKESQRTYESAMRRGYNANHSRMMVTIFDEPKYRAAVAAGKIPEGMRETYFKGGAPPLRDWWEDIKILGGPKNKERTNYPTQKPLALLDRIIRASSNEGDVVLDPFCGCATTCVAAENVGRQWIGIDLAEKAGELVMQRLSAGDDAVIRRTDITLRDDVPQRTDLGPIPPYNCPENRERLYGRQEGYCNLCKHHFEARHLEVDHVVAQSRGGHDHIDNLQLLCGNCNKVKGTRSMAEAIARRAELSEQ